MNALLEQFLSEAGELLSAVDDGLLRLERDPADASVMDEVFRAAHTFKGSSGLFELPALTALTHAAEDLLDAVRGGELALQSDDVDALLEAFDVVRGWLDVVADTEALPADADAVASTLGARLRSRLSVKVPAPRTPVDEPVVTAGAPAWLLQMGEERLRPLAAWLTTTGATLRALRYVPEAGCFFRGEDPLHLVGQVPALEALHVGPSDAWPALAEMDEYDCRLVLTALTRAGLGELRHLFRYVDEEVELAEVGGPALTALLDGGPAAAEPEPVDQALLDTVNAVLRAQRDVLAVPVEDDPERERVRLQAAVGVAVSALQSLGADSTAAQAAGDAELDGDEGAFSRWLAQHLGDDVPADAAVEVVEDVPVEETAVEETAARSASKVLKVDAAKVDALLELVGELVVAKNALPFLADDAEAAGARVIGRRIKEQYAVLDRIAEALQGGVMDVRMLPVQVAFARMPRLVRDLSRKLGKSVDLVVEGEDTAADKDVIEALGDPLVHLVRNALDHGIETPEQRRDAGKAEGATLRLSARQDGEAVVVELADDGRGVDVDRVKQRAYERGLITEAQLESMPDQEAVELVFAPGFSTAAQISDVSGRGVGMDAVRSTVEALGGSVTLTSTWGSGMTVRLRLPLSMAVSRVMVVSVAGQRFGVPVDVVRETVRVPREEAKSLLDSRALVLRDTVVPLVDLAEALELGPAADGEQLSALVVDVAGTPVGLVVDRFHQDTEVLLKPLEGVLADLPGLSGTALLGDGQVLLVLDTEEVLACP